MCLWLLEMVERNYLGRSTRCMPRDKNCMQCIKHQQRATALIFVHEKYKHILLSILAHSVVPPDVSVNKNMSMFTFSTRSSTAKFLLRKSEHRNTSMLPDLRHLLNEREFVLSFNGFFTHALVIFPMYENWGISLVPYFLIQDLANQVEIV